MYLERNDPDAGVIVMEEVSKILVLHFSSAWSVSAKHADMFDEHRCKICRFSAHAHSIGNMHSRSAAKTLLKEPTTCKSVLVQDGR